MDEAVAPEFRRRRLSGEVPFEPPLDIRPALRTVADPRPDPAHCSEGEQQPLAVQVGDRLAATERAVVTRTHDRAT